MLGLACALTACATGPDKPDAQPAIAAVLDPYPSTYRAPKGPPILIRSATVLTGTGTRLDAADLLIVEGRISAIGAGLAAPAGAMVIEAGGRWVTPGLIDVHSHLGVYPSPGVEAHDDGNEVDGTRDGQRVGRALRVAAGPWLCRGASRRYHHPADSARARRT